jgi:hypothetical protein
VANPARAEDQQFRQALQAQANPAAPAQPASAAPPTLPADVPQFYLPLSNPIQPTGATLLYQPRLLGGAEVLFFDKKRGLSPKQTHRLLAELLPGGQVNWSTAERLAAAPGTAPQAAAQWAEVPEAVNTGRKLKALTKVFSDFLYSSARLLLRENPDLQLLSEPGEDAQTFQQRCRAAALKRAEAEIAQERGKFEPKFAKLGAKVPEGVAEQQGATLLNAINPIAWLGYAFSSRPTADVKDKLSKLTDEWLAKQRGILEKWQKIGEEHDDIPLTPRRQDVLVTDFGVAWVPYWQVPGAGRVDVVAAYR